MHVLRRHRVQRLGGAGQSHLVELQQQLAADVQAILDEVMEQLLFTDGTLWEAAPPPTGLRPVAFELVHTLIAVQARQPACCWRLKRQSCLAVQ